MHSEKGVTLAALVVIIIVIAILTGTAVYSGTQSLQESKKTRFITELRMVQEKIRLSEYDKEFGNTVGTDYTGSQQDKILSSEGIVIDSLDGYRYLTKEQLESDLQLSGISRNVLINFETKDVISEQGIKIDGKWCYTLRQVGVEDYVTTFDSSQMGNTITFTISQTQKEDPKHIQNSWIVSVDNVSLDGYPQKYEAYYREYQENQAEDANWKLMTEKNFETDGGDYEVRIIDSYGNKSNIERKAFSKLPPLGGELSYKEGTLEDGYVVTDNAGNEYVWIQVDGIYGEDGTDTTNQVLLGRYDFAENGTVTPYSGSYIEETPEEHASSGYTNAVAKNITRFINSVRDNGGFYIARYEASQGTDGKAESKYGKTPWTNIMQTEASTASQNKYNKIQSDLINSYAWDTALLFIQHHGTADNAKTYSQQKGGSTFEGAQALGNTGCSILTETGLVDEQCHIFDLTANCSEMSTESTKQESSMSLRGSAYSASVTASSRQPYAATAGASEMGFRTILYI